MPFIRNTTVFRFVPDFILLVVTLTGFAATTLSEGNAAGSDPLLSGFQSPPSSARPLVWWHWMNGNVSREGITRDLEAMKRVGIAGVQIFTADLDTPVDVKQPLVYMSPEWLDTLRFAASECKRLGLEMAIHSAAGWSETGGTWVKPADAMQKLTWSETRLQGPRRMDDPLPTPPSVFGPFQTLSHAHPGNTPPKPGVERFFYRDAAVLAFPTPVDEAHSEEKPIVASDIPGFDPVKVSDGDGNTQQAMAFPSSGEKKINVTLTYGKPFTARSWTTWILWDPLPIELAVSDDGAHYRTIATAAPDSNWSAPTTKTVTFAPVTGRFFRITFRPANKNRTTFHLAEMGLSSRVRVNRFEDKALFSLLKDYGSVATAPVATTSSVVPSSVVDLSDKMDANGKLHWDVPPGRWTVLRLGHSPTGKQNGPAPATARGLEVDKLDRGAVTAYFDGFIPAIQTALGPLFGKPFGHVLMDSWEAGHQNWTPNFVREFARRRGYDPRPFLPAMTGQIVGGAHESDRFLEDVRRTISDLVAENHYGAFADLLHARGLGLYAESVGIGQPMIADGLAARGMPDVPMGEFWVRLKEMEQEPDCKLTASAAHIYGKTVAAAEAFTTAGDKPAFGVSPYMMKRTGDLNLAAGINRLVIHEYAHQPTDTRKPGFTLGPFGAMFNRQITWWEQGAAWLDYLARASYLLQQGHFRGDILYYYGEDVPVTVPPKKDIKPAVPEGYDYDFVNADVLQNRISVASDGSLRLPDGGAYRILVSTTRQYTPPVLERLRTLLQAGVTLVGERPLRAPGLAGFPESDRQIAAMAAELWGPCDGSSPCEHPVGNKGGKIVAGKPLHEVLGGLGVVPDLTVAATPESRWAWIHRSTDKADLYFFANQREVAERMTVRFRTVGKVPELWHPDTGLSTPATAWRREGQHTVVDLDMDPAGSLFVVFRRPGKPGPARPAVAEKSIQVTGPWQITWNGLAAPQSMRLDALVGWPNHPDPAVRHFAGSATYETNIELPRGIRVTVDLGEVYNFAEVSLDGKRVGPVLWKPPFRVDLGSPTPGKHTLAVRVTNMWPNRLIGDLNLPEAERVTWTTHNTYKKDSPLQPSGLVGPVALRVRTR